MQRGYSLIELVVVLVIIGVLASVAMKSLRVATDTTRMEETKQELQQLAFAIAGNPEFVSGGTRINYGYVGDIGTLPINLDALVTNPGGYATWNGPYIQDEFASGAGNSEFKIDGWGVTYSYSGGITISSTGSSSTITRCIANSTDDLLYNTVEMAITDLNNTPPGSTYKDSVRFVLYYPDGSGSTTSKTKNPGTNGFASFDSIPIGIHTLKIVYIPDADTLTRKVNVDPGNGYYADLHYHSDVW